MARKQNDIVTIYCYSQKDVMKRQEAIKFYKEAAQCCDGCEKERYTNILIDLLNGNKICRDT